MAHERVANTITIEKKKKTQTNPNVPFARGRGCCLDEKRPSASRARTRFKRKTSLKESPLSTVSKQDFSGNPRDVKSTKVPTPQ